MDLLQVSWPCQTLAPLRVLALQGQSYWGATAMRDTLPGLAGGLWMQSCAWLQTEVHCGHECHP